MQPRIVLLALILMIGELDAHIGPGVDSGEKSLNVRAVVVSSDNQHQALTRRAFKHIKF
jgi:hypothetical protein